MAAIILRVIDHPSVHKRTLPGHMHENSMLSAQNEKGGGETEEGGKIQLAVTRLGNTGGEKGKQGQL